MQHKSDIHGCRFYINDSSPGLFESNKTSVTSETKTAYLSGAPGFFPFLVGFVLLDT